MRVTLVTAFLLYSAASPGAPDTSTAPDVDPPPAIRSPADSPSPPVASSDPLIGQSSQSSTESGRPDQWSGRTGLPALIYLHGGGGSPPRKGKEHWVVDEHGNRMRFVVYERNDQLRIEPHDWVFPPNGGRKYRTLWQDTALLKRVYDEAVRIYHPDQDRIILTGDSRGAHGTTRFGLDYPELFAALLASQPRWLQTEYGGPNGVQSYRHPVDEVAKLKAIPRTPFIGWSVGRRDSYSNFQQQIRAARALMELRRPFAFAWNNGDHGGGALRFGQTIAIYKSIPFDRRASLPVFFHSSCDDDFDSTEGGINLGYEWRVLEDSKDTWRVDVRNTMDSCQVDVLPYGARVDAPFQHVELAKDQWKTLTFRQHSRAEAREEQ